MVQFATGSGLLGAVLAISRKEDAWNFWIKASMVALEERLGHRDEARKLKDESLDILRIDDALWGDVLDRATDRFIISVPPAVAAPPRIPEEIEMALTRVLDKLEPLLRSMGDNLRISHALHDRLDLIVDKLIDLNQRSELTWQQIRKLVPQEPDYQEVRGGIEASLADRLGDGWRLLKPGSRKDLVDAEYVFEQCTRWGTGWRMAVLGYCTTAERELKASVRAIKERVFPVANAVPATADTLGDLIEALEKLGTWLRKSKSYPPALKALLDSIDLLWQLNSIRIRAAHPTDKEVSREEAAWVKETLVGSWSDSLLNTILSVRLK